MRDNDYSIAFCTESPHVGSLERNHPNARTDIAWQLALHADNIPIGNVNIYRKSYDLIILIIPKNIPNLPMDFVDRLRTRYSCKVAIMQEGPNWNFQDLQIREQFWYYHQLLDADFLFCHNLIDKKYYEGITNKCIHVLPPVMIEDSIFDYYNNEREEKVMIGGNYCSWYGGFDSTIVSNEFDLPTYIVSMGRKKQDETLVGSVEHLPYMYFREWMENLSTYKYAVHMMRTYAAGTFFLNTAYFGIPTIGYNSLDTARNMHPLTTVDEGDMKSAIRIAKRLKNDKNFYAECSKTAKYAYEEMYTEQQFLIYMNSVFDKELTK